MIAVYVAGPFIAPTHLEIAEHQMQAQRWAGVLVDAGAAPFVPHTNAGLPFIDTRSPAWWYQATLEMMLRADAVLVFAHARADGTMSKGVANELRVAGERGLPVLDVSDRFSRTYRRPDPDAEAQVRRWIETIDARRGPQ